MLLVEGDPGGGDLAARFRLSAKRGWASYAASSRRLEGVEPIAAHLQQLPGGLEVMVSGRSGEPDGVREVVVSLLASIDTSVEARCDVIADIGRLLPGERGAEAWLERSTVVAVVVRRDAPSVLHLRDRAAALRSRCRGGVGLVVIGTGPYSGREIEEFTGMPVLGELPDDPDAAEIAGGRPGRSRLFAIHARDVCPSTCRHPQQRGSALGTVSDPVDRGIAGSVLSASSAEENSPSAGLGASE